MSRDEDVLMGNEPPQAFGGLEEGKPVRESNVDLSGTSILKNALDIFQGRAAPGNPLEAGRRSSDISLEFIDSLSEPDSEWPDDDIDKHRWLPLANLSTGLCYDVRMRYHCEVKPTYDVHPEDPRRTYYIYKEFCKAGLVDDSMSSRPLVPIPLKRIDARDATKDEIELVHTAEHYSFVQSTSEMSEDQLLHLEATRDSIYFNNLTFTSSLLSCGGAIETVAAVVSRRVKNAIGVIRPPGHHAECDKTMGFCLFNNVSVATKVAQKMFPDVCRKVLIVDWDVHHGNGIQKAFYSDPNVLYISLHVYRNGSFYPGGNEGNLDQHGEGEGFGKNINVPWPTQGMGDGDYIFAFEQVIMPVASEFEPDLVIISAGFDAAAGDELGGCFVTPPCYAHMTSMLMRLANGRLVVCLEGGYNLHSISKSALAVTRTLMGEPPDRLETTGPSRGGIKAVREVVLAQSNFWRCLYPRPAPPVFQGNRLHDALRQAQAKVLYDDYKMTPLYIYRDSISKSFENQVLATPNYDQDVPLFLIFHDPPEVVGTPDPVTSELEAHNCWIADVTKEYIGKAIEKKYAVIDVNVPKHITTDLKTGMWQGEDKTQVALSDELSVYIWENYVEPNPTSDIFFVGIGDAYIGLANLLINVERVSHRVRGILAFAARNPIRAVWSNTAVWLSRWYKENSRVYVAENHGLWTQKGGGSGGAPKLSKRYGTLVKSPAEGLNEMMERHKEEAFEWVERRIEEAQSEESE